jgi:hypothetical protein
MPKAIVNGVDVYSWYDEAGALRQASKGGTIEVSAVELARGEAIEGPHGPALVTPKARADAAVAAAEEAAVVAKEAARVALEAAQAAAIEHGLVLAAPPAPVTDEDISGMRVPEIAEFLAANPGEAERVRAIETAGPNRKGVLDLLGPAPAA